MSDLAATSPRGALRSGWTATVEDYAIAGGWTCGGKVLVVVDAGGGVSGFEGRSGERRWHHPAVHTDGALAMTVHPNGAEFATTGQDGRIVIWDAAVGEIKTSVNVGKGWVEHAAWSPDGNRLAASLSRRVYVYDTKGQELWHSEDHPSTVSATAWAGSDELATACYGRVSFLEASSGTLRQKLEWKGSLVSMVLSPDGEVVACGSQDNTVHFWRRSTGEDSMMAGYFAKPSALAFDHTGTLLATSGGEIVTVWSFADGGPEGTRPGSLKIHVKTVTSLCFAPRGKRLASGARDGGVVLWELGSDGQGEPIGAALVGDVLAALAWRPDGRALAALDARGGVTTWRVGD